ncbi:MAG: hypothetical protein HQK88_00885 [Nitrospirae bacterium]|nr:hypothetical protein [Nitrospirota bacterium]MBF0535101.1 hypothetical protein [Nitrospirota bacterium]MBF0615349.1 hypothetical protein [Nitrospirota bacterium]
MVKIRTIVVSVILSMLFCTSSGADDNGLWEKYKTTFIQADGRVVDFYQGQMSHSEGQGYGMLLSVLYNDKSTFDKLYKWTKNNLMLRKDNLSVWSWGKRANDKWDVIDYNNATDGDVLIAFALIKAANKWQNNAYKTEGTKIVGAIRANLSVKWQGLNVLLPGYYGFTKNDSIVLNPSYIIPPAYKLFASVDDKAFWEKTYKDSITFLGQCKFSKYKLPGDWIALTGKGLQLSSENPQVFGYDAIRTFLYLSLDKVVPYPEGLKEISKIYKQAGSIPAQIDLSDNATKASVSTDTAPSGFYAIYSFAFSKSGDGELSAKLSKEAQDKLTNEKENYYSYTLYLLVKKGNDL